MKNILIVTDFIPSGGSITFIRGLTHELAKDKKNHITSIYFYDYQNKPDFKNKSQAKYIAIPLNVYNSLRIKFLPKRIYLLFQYLSQLKETKFDLVFTDLTYPTFAFQTAKFFYPNLRHIPIYHHIHGSFSEETKFNTLQNQPLNFYQKIKYKLFYCLEHLVLKHCTKISVNSSYSQKLTKKLHGNLPVEINKPGIDYSFSKQVRKIDRSVSRIKLGLNPQGKYVLFTSRIEPRKGVSTFFENITTHTKHFINTKFLICSHFVESPFLHNFLEKLDRSKLGSNVFLINTPSRYQLSLLYRATDVTIMPSITLETFGFSTLESYYYHTPVVAFDIGANSELIPTSHLIKYPSKNSWPKLYQKIDQILKKPDYIDYSKYNYSWEKYVKKMLHSF